MAFYTKKNLSKFLLHYLENISTTNNKTCFTEAGIKEKQAFSLYRFIMRLSKMTYFTQFLFHLGVSMLKIYGFKELKSGFNEFTFPANSKSNSMSSYRKNNRFL